MRSRVSVPFSSGCFGGTTTQRFHWYTGSETSSGYWEIISVATPMSASPAITCSQICVGLPWCSTSSTLG